MEISFVISKLIMLPMNRRCIMPDDLQQEEELLLKALEKYKEKKSQELTDKKTNTLPAVICAVL